MLHGDYPDPSEVQPCRLESEYQGLTSYNFKTTKVFVFHGLKSLIRLTVPHLLLCTVGQPAERWLPDFSRTHDKDELSWRVSLRFNLNEAKVAKLQDAFLVAEPKCGPRWPFPQIFRTALTDPLYPRNRKNVATATVADKAKPKAKTGCVVRFLSFTLTCF